MRPSSLSSAVERGVGNGFNDMYMMYIYRLLRKIVKCKSVEVLALTEALEG